MTQPTPISGPPHTSSEDRATEALWDAYWLLRTGQVINAAAVTTDLKRNNGSRPFGILATAIACGATAWEWRRHHSHDTTTNDLMMAAEVMTTSLTLLGMSRLVVRDTDSEQGDDWIGHWTLWGQFAIALALPKRPELAMALNLLPQGDACINNRAWLPRDTARRNVLNALGFSAVIPMATRGLRSVGAAADRAESRLITELRDTQAKRDVVEGRADDLRQAVDALRKIRVHLAQSRVDPAIALAEATEDHLRGWSQDIENGAADRTDATSSRSIAELTELVARIEKVLTRGDLVVVLSAALNLLTVVATGLGEQRRRVWALAGVSIASLNASSVFSGLWGLRERPGAISAPSRLLNDTWSPRADTLFAMLLIAFECASSDRATASVWAAGQVQVHIAMAAIRIPDPRKLFASWGVIAVTMMAADRYYTPAARKRRFRWQSDWAAGALTGLALRRLHGAVWLALNELEQNADRTIAVVSQQMTEAEKSHVQNNVHTLACQALRYVTTHQDDPAARTAQHLEPIIAKLDMV